VHAWALSTVVVETGDKTDETPNDGPTKLTAAQKVKVPFGLRGKARDDYLQKDLEDAFGDGDLQTWQRKTRRARAWIAKLRRGNGIRGKIKTPTPRPEQTWRNNKRKK
jgi:hypothetical protein